MWRHSLLEYLPNATLSGDEVTGKLFQLRSRFLPVESVRMQLNRPAAGPAPQARTRGVLWSR
jgi:hypothetical protein